MDSGASIYSSVVIPRCLRQPTACVAAYISELTSCDTVLDRRNSSRLDNSWKGRRCQARWIQRSKRRANAWLESNKLPKRNVLALIRPWLFGRSDDQLFVLALTLYLLRFSLKSSVNNLTSNLLIPDSRANRWWPVATEVRVGRRNRPGSDRRKGTDDEVQIS